MKEPQAHRHGVCSRSHAPAPGGQEERIAVPEWAPLVDIVEDDQECQIKAERPGARREDGKVAAEDGTLIIPGGRELENEEKAWKNHRIEGACGTFARSSLFPDNANPEHLSAEFKDAGLSVHLPKTPRAKPQNIEVKVA